MPLYRMCYLRAGKPAGQTFHARDESTAQRVVDAFESSSGLAILTLKRLGRSRFTTGKRERPVVRSIHRLHTLLPNTWPWPTGKVFVTLITQENQNELF